MYVHVCVCMCVVCMCMCVCVHVYVCMYVYREEWNRISAVENSIHMYQHINILSVVSCACHIEAIKEVLAQAMNSV